MRDIMFRGRDIKTSQWIYGYLFQIWEQTYILWGTTNGLPNMIDVNPSTVGQFTGLKDKNGKEIFEGDITSPGGVVVFGKIGYDSSWNGLTGFYFKGNYDAEEDFYELQYHFIPDEIEVIGNIHDNPELLESEGRKRMGKFKVGDKVRTWGSEFEYSVTNIITDANDESFIKYIVTPKHDWLYKQTVDEDCLIPIVEPAPDNISHPAHYTDGGIGTIDYIGAKLTAEEFQGYCKGNALKYISRAGKKGEASEDIDKAIVYLGWLKGAI